MNIPRAVGVVLLGLWIAGRDAHAEECRLHLVSSLQIQASDNAVLVPATVNGVPQFMLVDTGGYSSEVTDDVAKAQKMTPRTIVSGLKVYRANGSKLTQYVIVNDLGVGSVHTQGWAFLLHTGELSWAEEGIAGTLAPDFLNHFDVDFDFAARKMNLFSQDHCDGKVVYWSPTYAVVPFTSWDDFHIAVDVTLDGQKLQGIIDTGSTRTHLSTSMAHKYFGVDETGPSADKNADEEQHITPHTLEIGDVAVQNPIVYLSPDAVDNAARKDMGRWVPRLGPPMTIGENILRQLHLYIAYKEKDLYITPAAATPADPVTEGPPKPPPG